MFQTRFGSWWRLLFLAGQGRKSEISRNYLYRMGVIVWKSPVELSG